MKKICPVPAPAFSIPGRKDFQPMLFEYAGVLPAFVRMISDTFPSSDTFSGNNFKTV